MKAEGLAPAPPPPVHRRSEHLPKDNRRLADREDGVAKRLPLAHELSRLLAREAQGVDMQIALIERERPTQETADELVILISRIEDALDALDPWEGVGS